jgi:multiple sugar transport system substrate-binding protein
MRQSIGLFSQEPGEWSGIMNFKFLVRIGVMLSLTIAGLIWLFSQIAAQAKEVEIKIAYIKHPIQVASIALLEKWASTHNVKLIKYELSYPVYLQKITASLASGGDQFDIIWHNDDWGQMWKSWLETTDDVAGMDKVAKSTLLSFYDDNGKLTVVPMVHTVNTFFYRKDLLTEKEVPTTWDELVKISQRLQQEGKVKWGYVGGMAMNYTWHSFWWSMWSNGCDVFMPIYERHNGVLEKAGWKPALTEPCTLDYMNFWWDALFKNKISPPSMTSYTGDEALAVFMAGDAAFTVNDTNLYQLFNDPKRSKIVDKVGMAPWPMGPRTSKPVAYDDIWGWAIPKGAPAENKKIAKEMLGASLTDQEGQISLWKATGGPPPNTDVWPILEKTDPVFAEEKRAVFDHVSTFHAAYYTEKWPAIHKAYSDVVVGALRGKREDIPKALEAGMGPVHDAAVP